jgi:hypothetical protein
MHLRAEMGPLGPLTLQRLYYLGKQWIV